VTQIARGCAILGIPVDTYRLFAGDDPYYELWLDLLVEQVSDYNRRQAQKAKTKGTK
jgi:uncharacterized membrane protein YeiB